MLVRNQSVVVNNFSSSPAPLMYSVPQGSVLGPVLFVLYTTTLSDTIVSHLVNHQLFADNTQLQKSTPPNDYEALHHHHHHHHQHHHQSLNREGRWGNTDDFATSFLHFSLFFTALCDLPNSGPVHSLMLSSHLFLSPPCLLPPFTVPCKMV